MTSAKSPARVLVVEDSPTQAQKLQFLLEEEGLEVEVAADGREGVERFRSSPFDLVLSDVVMPIMSGFEFCRAIRSDAEGANVPILFLTALADPLDIIRGLEVGADNFIIKPYEPQELMARVQRSLSRRGVHRRATSGDEISLQRQKFTIGADKEKILDYLVSTFEDFVRAKQRENESRQAAETFRASQEFLQCTLDALAAHIAILDEQGTILAVNAEWRRFAEDNPWAPDRPAVGTNYLDVWNSASDEAAEGSAEIGAGIQRVMSGEQESFYQEYPCHGPDEEGWFAMRVTRFDVAGAVRVAVAHEVITEQRKLEEQLRQAQKMEAIGQLAGGVAHDFNNLLTGITGYAQLAAGQLDEDSQSARDLKAVIACAARAASLTQQLLAFSRRQPLERVPLDVNSVIEETTKMLRPLIGEDMELVFDAAADIGTVHADRGQMAQILMNLAVNARDAMVGGGQLIIETSNVALDEHDNPFTHRVEPGGYVALSVSDTGTGMDEATIEHIFEPFFTTKEMGSGTGLGLATIYGIVKQHDGYIEVQSEPGKGTTFVVYLPRVDEVPEELDLDAGTEVDARGTETVLICEDEDSVREVAERALREQGYAVVAAAHPEEAEHLHAECDDEIALLLTDIVMPGRDGTELYKRLAAKQPSLKVLYMSGYTRKAIDLRGTYRGRVTFLEKPFSPAQLTRTVRRVLDE